MHYLGQALEDPANETQVQFLIHAGVDVQGLIKQLAQTGKISKLKALNRILQMILAGNNVQAQEAVVNGSCDINLNPIGQELGDRCLDKEKQQGTVTQNDVMEYIGDKVQAVFMGQGLRPGTIIKAHSNGFYDVLFDHGAKQVKLDPHKIFKVLGHDFISDERFKQVLLWSLRMQKKEISCSLVSAGVKTDWVVFKLLAEQECYAIKTFLQLGIQVGSVISKLSHMRSFAKLEVFLQICIHEKLPAILKQLQETVEQVLCCFTLPKKDKVQTIKVFSALGFDFYTNFEQNSKEGNIPNLELLLTGGTSISQVIEVMVAEDKAKNTDKTISFLQQMQKIIERNSQIPQSDLDGSNLKQQVDEIFVLAATRKDEKAIRLFSKANFSIDNVLIQLIMKNSMDQVRFLVDQGVNFEAVTNQVILEKKLLGIEVLHKAKSPALKKKLDQLIREEDTKSLELFIKAGVDLENIVDQFIQERQQKELETIISAGFDCTSKLKKFIQDVKHSSVESMVSAGYVSGSNLRQLTKTKEQGTNEQDDAAMASLKLLVKAGANTENIVREAFREQNKETLIMLVNSGVDPLWLRSKALADAKRSDRPLWFDFFSGYETDAMSGNGCVFFQNHRYEGSWKDGKADGPGVLDFVDPKTKSLAYRYIGGFKDGNMDGECTVHYPDGSSLFTTMKEGKAEMKDSRLLGKKEYVKDDEKMVRYEGELHPTSGQKWGTGTAYFKTNRSSQAVWRYIGQWEQDKEHGKGICYGEKGNSILDGIFKDGVIWKGVGVHVFENGDRFEGNWCMGSITGQGGYTFCMRNEPKSIVGCQLDNQVRQLASSHHKDCCKLVFQDFYTGDPNSKTLRCNNCNLGLNQGYQCSKNEAYILCEACGLPDTFWNQSCRLKIREFMDENLGEPLECSNDASNVKEMAEHLEKPAYKEILENEVRLECNWICGVPSGPALVQFHGGKRRQAIWIQSTLRIF
mmetsp:Transcript_33447/g.44136  ORF Transcript_33447/g.44136 Transcript_33447/m.44136 type:complete len:969 (+) Transcript_33447:3-2909(+)